MFFLSPLSFPFAILLLRDRSFLDYNDMPPYNSIVFFYCSSLKDACPNSFSAFSYKDSSFDPNKDSCTYNLLPLVEGKELWG